MKINRESWHYRLATTYGDLQRHQRYGETEEYNFCAYSNEVVWGLFLIGWLVALVTISLWCFVDAIIWLVVGILYGFVQAHACAIMAILVTSIMVVTVLYKQLTKTTTKHTKHTKRTEPSFFSMWWRSVKDKVCFNVVVEKDVDV